MKTIEEEDVQHRNMTIKVLKEQIEIFTSRLEPYRTKHKEQHDNREEHTHNVYWQSVYMANEILEQRIRELEDKLTVIDRRVMNEPFHVGVQDWVLPPTYIAILKAEIEHLKSQLQPHDTGHIHTTISTLEHRVTELEKGAPMKKIAHFAGAPAVKVPRYEEDGSKE